MNWQVLEASNREIVEAYVEAVKSRDVERIRFWRSVLDDRLVLIMEMSPHITEITAEIDRLTSLNAKGVEALFEAEEELAHAENELIRWRLGRFWRLRVVWRIVLLRLSWLRLRLGCNVISRGRL